MDDEGQAKSAQAYQVIGTLLITKSTEINEQESKRALDYFSDWTAFDENFLPWPQDKIKG